MMDMSVLFLLQALIFQSMDGTIFKLDFHFSLVGSFPEQRLVIEPRWCLIHWRNHYPVDKF